MINDRPRAGTVVVVVDVVMVAVAVVVVVVVVAAIVAVAAVTVVVAVVVVDVVVVVVGVVVVAAAATERAHSADAFVGQFGKAHTGRAGEPKYPDGVRGVHGRSLRATRIEGPGG